MILPLVLTMCFFVVVANSSSDERYLSCTWVCYYFLSI